MKLVQRQGNAEGPALVMLIEGHLSLLGRAELIEAMAVGQCWSEQAAEVGWATSGLAGAGLAPLFKPTADAKQSR